MSGEESAAQEEKAEAAAKEELGRLLASQAWRVTHLYWVENENGEKVRFKPRWEQRELHNHIHGLDVVLKCRQPGISTYCALVFALDYALFTEHKTIGIIDKTDDDVKRKLEKIRFAYDHLDDADPEDPSIAKIGALLKATIRTNTDNKKEFELSNGSKIWAGTKYRGGTLQRLWITELGYISYYHPETALEIRKGALNTIHQGNRVIIESTHEGGKFGIFYAFVKLAMEAKEPLGVMDWRFHFFPWWRCALYQLEVDQWYKPSDEDEDYFKRLDERGIKLTERQKYWYLKKKSVQTDSMLSEFPSVEEECFEAVIKGAIYGRIISQLRAKKRIVDFEHDLASPLYTFWDLGFSDFTTIWLLQFSGRDILALAFRCNTSEGPAYYTAICRGWEKQYQLPIMMHFMPHDADSKGLSGKSAVDLYREAGLDNITVVERATDKWHGIIRARQLLPRFYLHKTNCGREWEHAGRTMPSGIGCLEGYHTREDASSGVIKEEPVHDDTSHGCDGLRTFSEAELAGLLEGQSLLAVKARWENEKPKVILAGWNRARDDYRSRPSQVIRLK